MTKLKTGCTCRHKDWVSNNGWLRFKNKYWGERKKKKKKVIGRWDSDSLLAAQSTPHCLL